MTPLRRPFAAAISGALTVLLPALAWAQANAVTTKINTMGATVTEWVKTIVLVLMGIALFIVGAMYVQGDPSAGRRALLVGVGGVLIYMAPDVVKALFP